MPYSSTVKLPNTSWWNESEGNKSWIFFLTKIELSCFSFPSTGSFRCCLSVLRSLVRGQVVFIIWKKHENITALPSRELMCNVGTVWISSLNTNIDPCFMRASHFAINYLSNSRKLLACVGTTICVRTLAQSRTQEKKKVKASLHFLRKTILCSETAGHLMITQWLCDSKRNSKWIVHIQTRFSIQLKVPFHQQALTNNA